MPAFSRASSSRLGNTAANPHWWLPKLIAPTVFGRGLLAVEIGINTVPSHVRPTLLHGGVSARRLHRHHHQVTRAEPTIEPVGIAQASRKLAQPIADTILDQRQAFLTPGLEEKMAQLPNVAQFGEQETTFATSLEEVFRNEDGDGVTLQEGAVLTSGGARFRSPGGEITRRSVRNPPSRTGMSDSCRRLAAYAAQAEIIGPSGRIFEPGCLCREARPAHKRAFAAQLAINAGRPPTG